MKRKFGSGQLKSVKSTLQPSTQSSIFAYRLMHKILQIHLKIFSFFP